MASFEQHNEAPSGKYNIQIEKAQGFVAGDNVHVEQHFYGPSPSSTRLQNLYNMVVQIRNTYNTSLPQNAIVGTGFIVSAKGDIVTCASVLRAAGLIDMCNVEDKQVNIYFPQIQDNSLKYRSGKVGAYLSQYDDDVVLLELIGEPTGISLDHVAILGDAKKSSTHPFRSFGFHSLKRWVDDGFIQGQVDSPEGAKLLVEPLHLRTSQIDGGMSGAPVLDLQRNLVVGIVTQAYSLHPEIPKSQEIACAVNACVLGFEPFNLLIHDEPWSLPTAYELDVDVGRVHTTISPNPGAILDHAPPPLLEWVGRDQLLKSLDDDWITPKRRITGLIGFGGEGKSSLARRWLDLLLNDASRSQPDGIFWWNFSTNPSVDSFFEAVLAYLWNKKHRELKKILPKGWADMPEQLIGAALLSTKRYLFILDELEVIQRQESDQYGLLRDERMRRFLVYFATLDHNSFCLVTSRMPLIDLINYITYIQRDVSCLSNSEGLALLHQLGVPGTEEKLNNIVKELNGYALLLSLVGTRLARGESIDISNLYVTGDDNIHYNRVSRILYCYDEYLTDAERIFLQVFSAFRGSVQPAAFQSVFCNPSHSIGKTLSALDSEAFSHLIKRLTDYRILYSGETGYTTHVLIRTHYQKQFDEFPRDERKEIYSSIAALYVPDRGEALGSLGLGTLQLIGAGLLRNGRIAVVGSVRIGVGLIDLLEKSEEQKYYLQLKRDCK